MIEMILAIIGIGLLASGYFIFKPKEIEYRVNKDMPQEYIDKAIAEKSKEGKVTVIYED